MASVNVYKVYEDRNFTAADSPAVLDISTDLETISGNGENQYGNSLGITNTGKYDITVEISMDGTTYGELQTLSSKSTDNINSAGVKKMRITHQGNDTGYQVKAYSRVVGDAMLTNGGVNASIIDNDTEPIDTLFAESTGSFTLSADTVASGLTSGTLVYTFSATAGHGLVATDEILLASADRSFLAEVTNVATNTITVDRPIDFAYPSASTFGLIINTNLAVDGSTTPRIFKVQAGLTPIFIRRVVFNIVDGSSMDDTTFGGIIGGLDNGVVMRFVNSFQKTIFNFKTNGDFAQWAYDLAYSDKRPSGSYGVRSRITFGGVEKHGVVLELSGLDELQLVVQDDLTDLESFTVSAQGNKK